MLLASFVSVVSVVGNRLRYSAVALVLEFGRGDEPQRRRVHAVAQASGIRGPSWKTWPEVAVGARERTSVRGINSFQSVLLVTASGSIGLVKLGHPVPLSYLSCDENSGWPETTST